MRLPLQNKSAYSKMQREHETLVSQLKQLQIFKEQAQTDSKDVGQPHSHMCLAVRNAQGMGNTPLGSADNAKWPGLLLLLGTCEPAAISPLMCTMGLHGARTSPGSSMPTSCRHVALQVTVLCRVGG